MAGNGTIALSWDAATDSSVTGYEYLLRGRDGVKRKGWVSFGSNETTAHTIASLTNGVNYRVRVRAVAGDQAGADVTVKAVPYLDPPEAPDRFQASRASGTITLSWDRPGDDSITDYQIRWMPKGSEFMDVDRGHRLALPG